jgi:ATP-dependent protease ClpP protease subunit
VRRGGNPAGLVAELSKLVALAERGQQLSEAGHLTGRGEVRVQAAAAGRTAVRVYGYIGSVWDEGITATSFAKELDSIGDGGIDLHLNSGGGSVFDAVAMHAALLNHPSDVVSYVDGVAASAASFLAMAGDEVVIEKPAKMMIHDASGIVLGNKRDMREMADLLDELDGTIAGIYADRTGKPAGHWAAAMTRTTWYSSAAAVEAGLADRVANDSKPAAPEDRRTQLIRARARIALRGAA